MVERMKADLVRMEHLLETARLKGDPYAVTLISEKVELLKCDLELLTGEVF